jgi:hypothetical protein
LYRTIGKRVAINQGIVGIKLQRKHIVRWVSIDVALEEVCLAARATTEYVRGLAIVVTVVKNEYKILTVGNKCEAGGESLNINCVLVIKRDSRMI